MPVDPALSPSPALSLVVPAFLAVFALVCLVAGGVMRRRRPESFVDKAYFFLAVQALVYAASMLLFVYGAHESAVADLAALFPLLLSALLVFFGARLRSPVLWTAGLATPGLGFFGQKIWVMLPFSAGITFALPQDPLWFFGLAALIFAMPFTSQWRRLWEDMEPVHTAISCMYILAGFWMLSSQHPSLLDVFGLGAHIWAVLLAVAAAVVIWIARALRDPILFGVGVLGVLAGLVEFLIHYP